MAHETLLFHGHQAVKDADAFCKPCCESMADCDCWRIDSVCGGMVAKAACLAMMGGDIM
jgi:hypothetical protein